MKATQKRTKPTITPGDGDPRHGTYNGYSNLKCRCPDCRAENADYVGQLRKRRPKLDPDDPRHGTYNGYTNYQCRCLPCCEASTASFQARYYRRPAATT